jgi:sugar lactone lactonase YvrE
MRTSSPALTLLVLILPCLSACTQKADPAQGPPKPPYEFLGEWGVKGEGPGQLSCPAAIATDAHGLVYIADAGSHSVHKFSAKGEPLLTFQDAALRAPTAIALDSGGAIYVADSGSNVVHIFAPNGDRIRNLRGGPGRSFKYPFGVAVDAAGSIYVAEFEVHRIQKLTPRGRFLSVWGRGSTAPEAFATLSAIALGEDGVLYVADQDPHRVLKFANEAEPAGSFETNADPSTKVGHLIALAADHGHLFALDAAYSCIRSWALDGRPGPILGLSPLLALPEEKPIGVASVRGEEILVLTSGPRVLRFRLNF